MGGFWLLKQKKGDVTSTPAFHRPCDIPPLTRPPTSSAEEALRASLGRSLPQGEGLLLCLEWSQGRRGRTRAAAAESSVRDERPG